MIYMKKSLALVLGFVIALMIAPSANAAVTDIFNSEVSPLTCTADPAPPAPIPANSRFCGNYPAASTVASFDGTPIDVYVALPPDPGGTEPQRQAVGLFHGWGGTKINLKTDPLAQNLLAAGFVVFTMTDRGWGNSCGGPSLPLGASVKTAPCEKGYIHLMHNAYEVRDAQTVLGKLADDKEDTDTNYLIDASKIGAAGGSYGGAISAALAMLKNRVQDSSGNYSTWQSPVNARNMAVAAAAPQYTWSDLAASLVPNGSTLDYASKNPYKGPNDDRRTGTAKQQWVFSLYASGLAAGYYGPAAPIGPGYPDPAANMFGWYAALTTGGPFDGSSTVNSALNEITNNHSSYYIPISPTQTPAPMLISGGWNDDLFPFNEAIRLYNKVRDVTPTTPVAVWGIDIGHTPRSNGNNAARTTDATALIGTQVTWMVRYLRDLPAPWPVPGFNPIGGAVATSSKCGSGGTAEARVAGDLSVGSSWAAMAKGEVTVTGGSTQTIDHHTTPADQFVSSASNADVCDYAGRIEDTPGAAVYTSDPAGSGGYTIIGSPTVDATMDVKGSNDQVIARLYDYDPAGIGHQRLIGRAIYRPMGVGDGPTRQTFQLFPQNYKVSAGNQLKLELLSSDSPFAQNAKNTEQKDLDVSNLKLTVPVAEVSGAAGGQVTDPTPKTLPAGYTMTSDALATDTLDPVTTDDVPAELRSSVTVTLDAVDQGISGVKRTYYEIGASPATPTKFSAVYDSSNKPTLADGQKISYFSVDNAGNEEAVKTSIAAMVDSVPPDTATLVSGPAASITTDSTSVAFSSPELGGTFACSLDGAPSTACTSPVNLTDLAVGAHSFRVWVFDSVGNVSVTPLTVDFTVVGTITASVKVSGTVRAGRTITAKPSATAFGKALSGASYSYKWTVNGKKAGSSSKLKLKSSWKKKKIVVSVTASKAGYTSGSATRTATKRLK
jgi:hypothetical protein